MRHFLIIATAGCAVLVFAPAARAGLYHKDVLIACDIDENGNAIPFSLDSFLAMLNEASGSIFDPKKPETEMHKELVRATEERRKRGQLSPDEMIMQSADLLRLNTEGSVQEVINLLQRISVRPPDGYEFLLRTHLAHAYMLRRDFAQAFSLAEWAVEEKEPPKTLKLLSDKQMRWYYRLEKDYYVPFLRQRDDEERRKLKNHDKLDSIFPTGLKRSSEPLRYIGDSGQYEAGSIAEAESKKLAHGLPDAIAVVQQMILWNPTDNRLYWQLGELYNAAGDLRAAAQIFNELQDFSKRNYNSAELKKHAEVVSAAYQAQLEIEKQLTQARKRAEEEKKRRADEEQQEKQRRLMYVLTGVAVVLVFVSYWQTREFIRRFQARRAKAAVQPNQVP